MDLNPIDPVKEQNHGCLVVWAKPRRHVGLHHTPIYKREGNMLQSVARPFRRQLQMATFQPPHSFRKAIHQMVFCYSTEQADAGAWLRTYDGAA